MRYFIELSYKGTHYHGWQIQPDAISIQEVLTQGIATILQDKIEVVGAGRTDAGVHSSQMFAHFETTKSLPEDIVYKFNSILPDDIVIHNCFEVKKDLHARFDAIQRSYEYRVLLGRNPFLLETTWQLHHQSLDVNLMNEAAKILYE